MKVEIHAQIGDDIPRLIWNAHEIGSTVKANNSSPCSICQSGSEEIHFHCTDIGGCGRKIYWKKLTKKTGGISSATFLNDGHLHEHSMLANIKAGLPDNCELYIAENTKEGKIVLPEFEIIGHLDAIISIDGISYGVECKSVKQAMWKRIKEEQEIPDEWYGQVQGYMVLWQMDRWYIFVKHRETSNVLMPIRVDKDLDYMAERLNKLSDIKKRIINNLEQPNRERAHPKEYECLWCPKGNNIGDGSCWIK